ncbi:MAG: phenylalanine 4-monooxygenase [Gemmatimonadetes bacterium]|nr:phenylalanine 4-monooxygenase [Gemmatimonadota bacterium]
MATTLTDGIAPGLTTTRAPFIEHAQANGQLYIDQPYALYSEENHRTWSRLLTRMHDRWERYANSRFLEGVATLHLDPDRVPRCEDINRFLEPRTGFKAKPVSGYVPAYLFFDSLKNREFPTTITVRDGGSLDYLPEPDIFHDIAGHVPMHTDPAFAEALVRFGQFAERAAKRAGEIRDEAERIRVLTSNVKGLARFFWFTVEFGLMREKPGAAIAPGHVRAYGSGLLSSYGELGHCVESPEVQRFPAQVEWMINQYFEIHHYQPLLFVIDDFEHLFYLVHDLEQRLNAGLLDNLQPGEPEVNEVDLKSFLDAALAR